MRYLTAPVGYVALVLIVLVVATGAVLNLYEMTAKPARSWDADIDRIVALHREKKRVAALAPQSERAQPAQAAADNANTRPAAMAMASSIADDDGRAERKAETAAQSSKKPGRRAGQPRFLPAAFASLPKFAAETAASTLLRLR